MRILEPSATRQLLAAIPPRSPFGARDEELKKLGWVVELRDSGSYSVSGDGFGAFLDGTTEQLLSFFRS